MTQTPTQDDQLDSWLTVVDRKTRRHGLVDRSLQGDQAGPLTIPLRFGFKVLEIGPLAAAKLAIAVVAGKLGRR